MPSLSPSSLPRSARGQITWVTAAILAALLGGGYLLWRMHRRTRDGGSAL
jgi:hypothetical protein